MSLSIGAAKSWLIMVCLLGISVLIISASPGRIYIWNYASQNRLFSTVRVNFALTRTLTTLMQHHFSPTIPFDYRGGFRIVKNAGDKRPYFAQANPHQPVYTVDIFAVWLVTPKLIQYCYECSAMLVTPNGFNIAMTAAQCNTMNELVPRVLSLAIWLSKLRQYLIQ